MNRALVLTSESPQQYFRGVARLHKQELKAGLLAQLSERFLMKFYRFIAKHPNLATIIISADDEGSVSGFICGTKNTKTLYINFVKTHCLSALSSFLYLLSRPQFFKRVFSLGKYLNKGSAVGTDIHAELLSLAVDPQRARGGLGKQLFNALTDFFSQQSVHTFKVTAAHTQQAAQQFYLSMGGTALGKIELGLLESSVYKFDLPALLQ